MTEKMAYSIMDVVATTSLRRSMIYLLIKSGGLPARKASGRTIIMRGDLELFLAGLPMMAGDEP